MKKKQRRKKKTTYENFKNILDCLETYGGKKGESLNRQQISRITKLNYKTVSGVLRIIDLIYSYPKITIEKEKIEKVTNIKINKS